MNEKHYFVYKNGNEKEIIYLDYNRLHGFDFVPKSTIKDGIVVNKMVIIKPSMIEKVLRRKIKKKLDLYLKLIMNFIESDDSDNGESLREALNDLTRYKSIIRNKYQKYLDQKYLTVLSKKISILEYEIQNKLINIKTYEEVEENTRHRSR